MSTAALEEFIKKYQTAKNHNSKEIRLTTKESEELSTAIALLLSKTNSLNEKIIELQNKLLQEKSEINLSGGNFS
ncbi:MAG: hypothetical protein K2X74_10970 [Acetobacteraceae bacterium]|nr:hypothetical protein [Acetobacteraceae bacterium]